MSDEQRNYADQRCIFFVASSVFKTRSLLDLDQPKRTALGVLNHLRETMSARCVGFVVTPDHVHALLWLPGPQEIGWLH
jgi:putative transposase